MSTASDNVHTLGHALLTGHQTGKRYEPAGDIEVGCGGCTSSRGAGTPWKFALVALIQVVAWTWILVTFVPMGNFGRPSGSVPLLLEGYDGSVVLLSDPSSYRSSYYSGSTGRRPAVNLWSDERHLINAQLGTDGASGTTIITGLGIRYADGTRIVLAEHERVPGLLRVAVDGQEYTGEGYLVQALTHEGEGIRLQYDAAAASTPAGIEGQQAHPQPQHRAVIITDEGLHVEVFAAGSSHSGEQQQPGLRVMVTVQPGSAAQQLSGKGPGGVEGLLGRTLRGAQQAATATAGSQQQQQQQQQQQARPDAAALYLVPHLLSEHPATNRFIAHRASANEVSL